MLYIQYKYYLCLCYLKVKNNDNNDNKAKKISSGFIVITSILKSHKWIFPDSCHLLQFAL